MPEAWKTLKLAIPPGHAKTVALRYRVHPDHVRRWRRRPLSDEAPLASGQRSPLDRVCDLIDAVFLAHPTGAVVIADHVQDHYRTLIDASTDRTLWDRRKNAAAILREAVEAVNALNLGEPDDKTIGELVEARAALDIALANLRRDESGAASSGSEANRAGAPTGEGAPADDRRPAT